MGGCPHLAIPVDNLSLKRYGCPHSDTRVDNPYETTAACPPHPIRGPIAATAGKYSARGFSQDLRSQGQAVPQGKYDHRSPAKDPIYRPRDRPRSHAQGQSYSGRDATRQGPAADGRPSSSKRASCSNNRARSRIGGPSVSRSFSQRSRSRRDRCLSVLFAFGSGTASCRIDDDTGRRSCYRFARVVCRGRAGPRVQQ